MYLIKLIFSLSNLLTVAIIGSAAGGDYILLSLVRHPLSKALCDNITHALVGGLSWGVIYINTGNTTTILSKGLMETFACTILSSFIDLDHFMAAKSILLKDATALSQRPILHCSTIPLAVVIILLGSSYLFKNSTTKLVGFIILTAFASHHIRDATRRGLWLWPFGSTPPIPYGVYLLSLGILPYFVIILNKIVHIPRPEETYSYVV